MKGYEEQKRIRAVLMRGGTSRGLFVMRNELPVDPEVRDRVILRMYGSVAYAARATITPNSSRTTATPTLVARHCLH